MNARQIRIMWAGIILLVLMAIFPPWAGNKQAMTDGFIGFRFVFARPSYKQPHGASYQTINGERRKTRSSYTSKDMYENARIDYGRFCLGAMVIVLLAGGFVFKYRTKVPPDAVKT